jgi:hypothetical protein
MLSRFSDVAKAAVVLGLLPFAVPNVCLATEAEDFLGRWEVTIADTGDTFFSSWLEVTKGDGGLSGKLLWKWGSVGDMKSVEVVGGELRVIRRQHYEDKPVDVVYRAKLVDGKLVGAVKQPDGSVRRFTGVRSVEKVDVSGAWQLEAQTPRRTLTLTLVLKQEGSDVSGKFVIPERGREIAFQEGEVEGTTLRFSVPFQRPGRDAMVLHYSAEVRGDKLVGTAKREGGDRETPFTAQRQREWGDPIQLFNGKNLAGWRPRDPNRGFHWSVKDEVLVNRPPDQDIISEKEFQDFKLHVEFSMGRRSNSGIYLRGRYELQLLDDFDYDGQPRKPGKHNNCSIYSRLAPSVNASKPAGEWQTLEATLVGRWLTVVLNGQTVLDNVHLDGITGGALDPNESEPGPLTFQGDHGLVRFRKIAVQPALD